MKFPQEKLIISHLESLIRPRLKSQAAQKVIRRKGLRRQNLGILEPTSRLPMTKLSTSHSPSLPSITLGLLTTVLGITGILKAANAKERPEPPNLALEMGSLLPNQSSSQPWHEARVPPRENAAASVLELQPSSPQSHQISTEKINFTSFPVESRASRKAEEKTPAIDHSHSLAPPTQKNGQVSQRETLPEDEELPSNTESERILAPNEVRILTPESGVIPKKTTNLVAQYSADASIQVNVNQNPLDPSIVSTQELNEAENRITQIWYNIPLEEGENTITVQAGNGTPVSVKLTVEEIASRKIEIFPLGDPRIPANGRGTIALEGRITDENSQLITEEVIVTLTANAGNFVGADQDTDQPGFQTLAVGGEFTARLQSGLEAQKVRVRAAVERLEVEDYNLESIDSQFDNQKALSAYTQVEFITNLRPSLVSGVVNLRIGQAGTDFWGSRRDFLDPDLIDDGTEFDLDSAIFATGRVGEWLFTGAYNSDRPLNETCDGTAALFRGPQSCEKQYPVYGDSSTVEYLTPSTDSVYLRFERTSPVPGAESDYAMWGDYQTQEFARESQLFSATARTLHGFKGNYNLGNLQLTALYSQDIEGFQRDTIAPNGTSGYYFLQRRQVIDGSEIVVIEVEDINRPGTVLERQYLRRGIDYQINYDQGSLLFNDPVFQTEFNFFNSTKNELTTQDGIASPLPTDGSLLVRRIVVTYQYDGPDSGDTNLYGGRLQYNFSQEFGSESWIGATYLQEDEGVQDFELYGADFLASLGNHGQVIGEYAYSSYDSLFRGDASGSAYRLEVASRLTPGLRARAYYRSVEENFLNNATTSFTPGQTRYGAEATAQLGATTNLRVGYDFEENFGIAPEIRTDFFDLFNPGVEAAPGSRVDNQLTTIRAGIEQKIGAAVLGLDYVNRSREDDIGDTFEGDANQLVSSLGLPLTSSLTFLAKNELNLGDDDDPLYPNRTTLGLDWEAYPGVRLQLAHQFFEGGLFDDDSITRLDTIVSHRLWKNTDITGRYSVISGFSGLTGQGALGVNHGLVLSPGLRLNLGYEHTFSNTSIVTAAGERFEQPYSPGQTAASLALLGGNVYTVGVEYTDNPDFKASANFQHRSGSGNDNTVISASAAGKLSPAFTLLGRYQQANFANQRIEGLGDSISLKLGLAYRNPVSDRWNALLRYEYRQNPYIIPESSEFFGGTDTDEHVVAAEAIFAPSWRWEFYSKGALRYSRTQASDFDNSTTTILSQLRATYRLGYRTDLAVEGRWIGQSATNYSETAIAVEAGYYLTPDLRLALGYSFGSIDDDDFSGYRSEDGVYFGLTFKVNELWDGFGRQQVTPPQQQESEVAPLTTEAIPSQPPEERIGS
ncbi:hypothetical protein [Lyngbya aestuarii]|uniref:hypothetical protein n=1 Tax=Lyngbya aestuarii TaxID=118322 RepID=UPI00403D90E8